MGVAHSLHDMQMPRSRSSYPGRACSTRNSSDKKYLQSSFHAVDLDNTDLLPDILLKPDNFQLAKSFISKWNTLKKREQKSLINKRELIECPEQAYFGGRLTKLRRKPSKQRYKSKFRGLHTELSRTMTTTPSLTDTIYHEDIAGEASRVCESNPGAKTRLILKPSRDNPLSNSDNGGYVQVMSANNKPLCIKCQTEYETDLLSTSVISDEKHAWQTRFCSPQCADSFMLSRHGGYIRDTAKSLDAGVCELCAMNANELFQRIKHTRSLKERAELLQGSRYASMSSQVKVNMVKNPVEGQFWHVDHVLPVYAGGGQCDIDNLRTLCTPCHQTVTSAQAGHRSRCKASIANQSITDFFSPATKEKLKELN